MTEEQIGRATAKLITDSLCAVMVTHPEFVITSVNPDGSTRVITDRELARLTVEMGRNAAAILVGMFKLAPHDDDDASYLASMAAFAALVPK